MTLWVNLSKPSPPCHSQDSLTDSLELLPLLPRIPSAAWPGLLRSSPVSSLRWQLCPNRGPLPWGPDSQPGSLQFPSSQAGLCSKLRRTPKSPHRDAHCVWYLLEPHQITALGLMMLVWVKLFVYLAPQDILTCISPHLIVPLICRTSATFASCIPHEMMEKELMGFTSKTK